MKNSKMINRIIAIVMIAAVILGNSGSVSTQIANPTAANRLANGPSNPKDETKVPHYFGPYPNYANSPQAIIDANVAITGDGSGATATASVDPTTGSLIGFDITTPGSGYKSATVTVTGYGQNAAGTANINASGVVTAITLIDPGAGYSHPVVSITGGGTLGTPVTAASVSMVAADSYSVDTGSATGGTFKLTVDAATTTGINYNALAADVQSALSAAGVSATVTGSGTIADPWSIVFTVAPTTVTIDGTDLVETLGPAVIGATATASGGVDVVTVTAPGTAYSQNATVDFDLPDLETGVKAEGKVNVDVDGHVISVDVTNPGSGYLTPPGVTINDGMTRWDVGTGIDATASATLSISAIALDTFGSNYASNPSVTITDSNGGTGSGATAVASTDVGAITSITLTNPGTGYITPGLKKFVDSLPGLCNPATGCPSSGKYIPLGVPDTSSYTNSDTYEIGLVQYHMQFSTQLPPTLVRGYVQLETPANATISQHFRLVNELLGGGSSPVLVNGQQAYGVTAPQYLGPTLVATKDKPVRIVFRNLLPNGAAGNLFLPTDATIMGAGMDPSMNGMEPVDNNSVMDEVRNPMCDVAGQKPTGCFTDNRATLHLHGGTTPWISDGTPHQWITPAGENATYPQGVSVSNVPDMNLCNAVDDGCQTFFYTNQQSARLMFYHDHAWGITRLNVYAGEAAGYLITDSTEAKLVSSGTIPGAADTIPLIIQDKTFVSNKIAQQDPTWDASRWGGEGALWSPHVYMPAQNPSDPTGASAFGRWMYGPWFWPPATNIAYPPIPNPYYDAACDPNVADFCEPELIPGTPLNSVGMEAFNDTPVVNGAIYPTVTLEPKSYRLRLLNAAGDRFWNLQWYVGDPTTANAETGATEVALNPAEVAAALTDPNIFPTPNTTLSPVGPSWIQIGSEGGFLPAPAVVPNQPTTWITDPTRFDVGNVDKHSMLLAPAERADVIVDFSKYAGKTLILYNDAPAAFPARVAGYDYYTGHPDLSPVGTPPTLPGYGPNTRTIMQVKIAANTPATTFNLTKLRIAFQHHADGSGVFESGQHPIIVGQAAYNSAYGTNFVSNGWCNAPGSTSNTCDGFARISEQGGMELGFNTLLGPTTKMKITLQPKGIHDEMNSSAFDPFGRMQATIGLEAPGANPNIQNIILYPYINPTTEILDGTNLPKGDLNIKPISSAADGTQIWKITHNGVDTHPIHFHLFDVQILNRVTWDNIIIKTEASELGWKDTIRVSPLEDTIVALRPIVPTLPFEIPNSTRMLNPMMPLHSTVDFSNIDQNGNPTNPISNEYINFGWEYVYHCHILSHEEMDMMRPVTLAMPPVVANGLTGTYVASGATKGLNLRWNDNSIAETAYVIQRSTDGTTWTAIATVQTPLDQPNTKGQRLYVDASYSLAEIYKYRVVALNTVGYGGQFMSTTVSSTSASIVIGTAPAAPTKLTATAALPTTINLAWTDNAINESSFVLQRSNGGAYVTIATLPANTKTYADTSFALGATYTYRIAAVNLVGQSAYATSNTVAAPLPPTAPSLFTGVNGTNNGTLRSVILSWKDNSATETGFTIQRASNSAFTLNLNSVTTNANVITLTQSNLTANTKYYYRIRANNASGSSAWVNLTPFPITTKP